MAKGHTCILASVAVMGLFSLAGCSKPDPAVDAAHRAPAQQQPAGQTGTSGQPAGGTGTGITQPGATVPSGDL